MSAEHMSDVIFHPLDGWYKAKCTCGYTDGPFPDIETMVDALMEHTEQQAYISYRLYLKERIEQQRHLHNETCTPDYDDGWDDASDMVLSVLTQ